MGRVILNFNCSHAKLPWMSLAFFTSEAVAIDGLVIIAFASPIRSTCPAHFNTSLLRNILLSINLSLIPSRVILQIITVVYNIFLPPLNYNYLLISSLHRSSMSVISKSRFLLGNSLRDHYSISLLSDCLGHREWYEFVPFLSVKTSSLGNK